MTFDSDPARPGLGATDFIKGIRHGRLGRPLNVCICVVLAAAAYALPTLLGGSPAVYGACVTIAIFAVMAYGVDLVLSYLGEVSLGHTIFWAIGGYASALLSTHYDVNGWMTLAAAVVLTLAAAGALGWATLRAREFVFSLVTYAAAVVAMELTFNSDALGGSDGIVGIPRLELPLPFFTFSGRTNAELWPIAFILLALTIFFLQRFRRSRIGIAALMVQMNPALATTLGLNIRRVRFIVFVISAPITAMAGWLYAYQRAYVGPDMFDAYFLVIMLTAIIVVGHRILLGPLIGVSIVLLQQDFFSVGGDGNKLILGFVLAAVLILWPSGLVGFIELLRRRWIMRSASGIIRQLKQRE
jgi:branched-chain amino acid transport system permease protein